METCRNVTQNNRLCNRDLNAVHLMTTFQLMKESGKTSLQMSTAPNMIWGIMSSNVLDNWYVMKNRRHREADGAFRWRLIIRQKLKFTFLKQGGDQSYLEGKQLDTISVLPEFLRHFVVHSNFSRTHWRRFDRSRVDGSCRHTFQVETILISPRVLTQF